MITVLKSDIDESVNFIKDLPIGKFESRYVRREENKVSMYVSVQSGCNQGCRMCHLTKTKQTQFVNATAEDIVEQLKPVVEYYKKTIPAKVIHINYMARGEFFDNPNVNKEFINKISQYMDSEGLENHKHIISTIMPNSFPGTNIQDLVGTRVKIYYSLYSVDYNWRRKWFPKAMPFTPALYLLSHFERAGGEVRIHLPFIKGQNDSDESVRDVVRAVRDSNLNCKFNIVRYNDFDNTYQEPAYYHILFLKTIIEEYGFDVKIITKVGEDVFASCGTFVNVI